MQGGVGAFTQEIGRALAAGGHEIHVITSKQAKPPQSAQRLQTLFEPTDIGFAQLHPHIRRWRWPALSTIADLIIRYELDLVNIQYQAAAYDMRSPAANFLPWRLKGIAKTVVTFHDLRVPYLFPKAGGLRGWVVRFMAKQAHGVVATNQQDFDRLRAAIGDGRLCQIPIGSNIQTYAPTTAEIAAARTQLGLSPTDTLLGYFGFLNDSKGADTLLQALACLDAQTHLVFIGGQTGSSDPHNNQAFGVQLQQMGEALSINGRIHFTGFLSDQQVSTYLRAVDMMVMPYRDGVSLRRGTLMAALAHGCPLITTHPAMPTPELVHGQNVWLVPPGDVVALAQAIQIVTTAPDVRRQLGEGAAQVAQLFTWDKIAAKTAEFFQDQF